MKNIIIIALVIACGILAYNSYFKEPEKKPVNELPPEAIAYVNAEVENINKEISKKGFEHAVFERAQSNIQDIKAVRDSAKAFKDSVLLELNSKDNKIKIKDKQLQSMTRFATSWQDSFMLAKQSTDTSYNYAQNGLKLELVIPKNNPSYFNYSYDADINFVEYWHKKNIFSKKKEYIDFWIEDKRATINGVKRLSVQKKPDLYKVELNASSIYYDRLLIGGQANIILDRYNIGVGYYYDNLINDWRPLVSAKFKLLEF